MLNNISTIKKMRTQPYLSFENMASKESTTIVLLIMTYLMNIHFTAADSESVL